MRGFEEVAVDERGGVDEAAMNETL